MTIKQAKKAALQLLEFIESLEQPQFKVWTLENFFNFSTGGFGLDKEQPDFINQWHKGKKLGVPHSFHYFYVQNKEVIDADPTILSNYKTHKSDPNLDNPKTLPLILEWQKEWIKKHGYAVVSPGDGLSVAKINLNGFPTLSAKYAWIANQVAKDNPDVKVKMNAYSNGVGAALAPDFPLQDNMVVNLIFWYQRDYETREQMIEDWQTKHPNIEFYLRDYLNITQKNAGLPTGEDAFKHTEKLINLCQKYGIKSLSLETTYSVATEPHLWVLGHNKGEPVADTYASYFAQFYEGNGHVVEFFKLLSNFSGQATLPFLIEALEKAENEAINKEPIYRLQAYVVWMVKAFESKAEQTVEKSLEWEMYTKRIRKLGVCVAYPIWRYNYANYKSYDFGKSPDKWTDFLESPSLQELIPEIKTDFEEIKEDYPVLFDFSPFQKDVLKVKNKKGKSRKFSTYLGKDLVFSFRLDEEKELTFNWNGKGRAVVTDNDILEVIDETGTLTASLLDNRLYYVSFQPEQGEVIRKIELPDDIAFVFERGRLASGNDNNTWNFYVPNVESIIFNPFVKGYDVSTKGKISGLFKPNGKPAHGVEMFEGSNTYIIPVEPEDRGKVWVLKARVDKWKIINFEPIISSINFDYESN